MIPNSDQTYRRSNKVILRINQISKISTFSFLFEKIVKLYCFWTLIPNSDQTYTCNEVIIRPSCNHEGKKHTHSYSFKPYQIYKLS